MEASSNRFLQGVLGVGLIAALPMAGVAVGDRLYAQAMIAIGAFLVGVVVVRSEWVERRIAAARSRIEIVDAVAAPAQPLTVRVLRAQGACPLGFQPGRAWAVDSRGHLSPVLCRGAIEQLVPLFQRAGYEDGRESQVVCRCPLAGDRKSVV